MTLKEIFNALNQIALQQPLVNSVIESGDIYDVNEKADVEFSVFCAVQQTHTLNKDENVMNYQFVLYYVDRLTNDGSNKIDAQSTGIQVLTNIIKTFENEYGDEVEIADAVNYEVFTESFKQLCAGAYATVIIQADIWPCVETYSNNNEENENEG